MKKPNSLQFILSAKKIISVNALYGAKLTYSGVRPVASLYKKAEAKKMEKYIQEQVKNLDLPNNHPWVTKDTKFKFTFTVIFKSGYFMRDLDNCCKNLIDGIFRALGYNDSHICEIHCYKTLCPEIPEEKICIEMSEFTGESRFDKVTENKPVPENIYLNVPDQTCIDELILELNKRGIKYTSTEKDNCDCELYLLTPGMKDMYPIAEIINAAYEAAVGGYGALLFGVLGKEEDWEKTLWDSLQKTITLVKEISAGSRRIIAENISKSTDILNYVGEPKKKRKTNG